MTRLFLGMCATGAVLMLALEGPAAAVPFARPDAHRGAALRDVRLGGVPAGKMHNFFRARMLDKTAQRDVFGEARSAFRDRDDDEKAVLPDRKMGGIWRGEFWGKLMLGTARVADYLQDPALTKFVKEECHRMIALQDPDGYLGSYADKENVWIPESAKPAMRAAYGWNTVWNLWNRKYAIWAMLMAYRTTGDRAILASTERQMDQWIEMMHRLGLPLFVTGQPEKVGLPSMSILKPLLMLYAETGKKTYLDYAKEMLPDWDRADGACPNFFRNADRADALHTWYPNPSRWAKSYEMMSCLDGLLEYTRLTGDARALETVRKIYDNLLRTELNVLGDVGYVDQFYGAATQPNASTEVCDTIHWIRLSLDLYLMTGDVRYCDAIELAYFNAFLAGVYRDGTWGAFAVRGTACHETDRQCGYAYNHCCVNNVPRTFMDMAEGTVTRDRAGVFHVNFYQDATATLDGVDFAVSGNYPVGNVVTVKVSDPAAKVVFRTPAWCPKLDVAQPEKGVWRLTFDMNPRLLDGPDTAVAKKEGWHYARYLCREQPLRSPLRDSYRATPAATVMVGPLLLAKSRRTGATQTELMDLATVRGQGYAVKVTPVACEDVWGAWDVELTKPGAPTIRTRACDYQSAGDDPYADGSVRFSIWF
ncbi:MAG: glycoside hydrolase family 127 protein [bacterium]|nr:glycoside hydrolase family 127 protein [bacterium]